MGIALYALAFPARGRSERALPRAVRRARRAAALALAAVRFLLAFALLLPPTFLMGASLPAIAQAVALGESGSASARRVAWLYTRKHARRRRRNARRGLLPARASGVDPQPLRRSSRQRDRGPPGVRPVAAARSTRRRGRGGGRAHARAPVEAEASRAPSPRRAAGGPIGRRRAVRRREPRAGIARPRGGARRGPRLARLRDRLDSRARLLRPQLDLRVQRDRRRVPARHRGRRGARRPPGPHAARARCGCSSLAAASPARPSLLLAIAAYRTLPDVARRLAGSHPLAAGLAAPPTPARCCCGAGRDALAVIFGQVALVLFLPALFLGAVFPLALQVASTREGSAAEHVGRLYAVNALGSVGGALLGTFVLVALLGTRGALLLLAWLPVPTALWALREASPQRRLRARVAAGLLVLGLAGASVVAAPPASTASCSRSASAACVWFRKASPRPSPSASTRTAAAGSSSRTAAGRREPGRTRVAGSTRTCRCCCTRSPSRPRSSASARATRWAPRASTAWCASTASSCRARSSAAAPQFAATNHGIAGSGRARIVIEDGRNYLLATRRSYDVITEEPPLVHTAGVVNLYSRDFYELASRRLTDDGIVAVWLATWELEPAEMRMLVRAFVDAFPYASVWDCTHPGEWLLIGAKRAPRHRPRRAGGAHGRAGDRARPRADRPRDGRDLRTPADLLSLHLMDRDARLALRRGALPVTDDRSVVDFTTPRHARANFGLGEWVTGGLTAAGSGSAACAASSSARVRPHLRVPRAVAPLIASYGGASTRSLRGRRAREGADGAR